MASSMTCPDPSAHRDTKLQEQASTAALLAASPRQKPVASAILDKDNKLSSRSAAMSLKHARPEDLPSWPSSGGVALSASSGVANLANANQKPFEHWKPDPSSAAGKAALLAKDYKMDPLWQPSMSAAGSKAALIAHKDGGKLQLWKPEASAAGNSAATQAFKKTTLSPNIDYGYTEDGRSKALLAATKSVKGARARSGSVPTPAAPMYPDSANSAYNALNAATKANRGPSTSGQDDYKFSSPALEESRIKHLSDKISREMFTDHPPVDIEVQEKKHQDALRASAISMAKGMYDLQQKKQVEGPTSPGSTAASTAIGRSNTTGAQPDIRQKALQYIHLQDAAHKLAEERLAKMDPDGAARYREHYGYPLRSPRRKLSIKDRYSRRRAKSDVQVTQDSDSDEDDFRSRRIRNQMNQFNKDIEDLDTKKRNSDRAALLAAAEKKVQAQMHSMDEKVYAETGKVSQAKLDEWEAKARETAARNSEKRTENFGKADLGGGKFMEQSEIEAIAAARLKPTLDEINENAERRRARDEEIRLDMEERKRQENSERQREREVKMLQKQTKDQEKATAKQEKEQQKAAQKQEKAEQKAAAKIEKDAEKARKAEEKKAAKEDKRRSRDVKRDTAIDAVASAAAHEATDRSSEQKSSKSSSESPHLVEDDSVSPVVSRTATGDAVLHPGIERHVTSISTSASEDEAEEPSTSKKAISKPTETVESSRAAHQGTDGPTTATPVVALPTENKDPESSSVKSPKSPKGISKLFDRLKRKSKHDRDVEPGTLSPDLKSSRLSKLPPVGSDTTPKSSADDEPMTSATVHPTESAVGALSAAEARNIAEGHATAAAASPSSFVRGKPQDDDDAISSLSSLTSDEPASSAARPSGDSVSTPSKTGPESQDQGTEKRRSFGLGIGMGKSMLPTFGKGKGSETNKRLSVDGSAKSPARETRFQEQL